MIGELLKAIKARWTAKSLSSVFTGGIHEGTLQPGDKTPVMPFVSVEVIGASTIGRATSSSSNKIQQSETVTVDFTVRARGGLSVCSGLVEQLKAVYSNMHATLGDGVTLQKFFWQSEDFHQDPDHRNIWQWTISYQADMEQEQTAIAV